MTKENEYICLYVTRFSKKNSKWTRFSKKKKNIKTTLFFFWSILPNFSILFTLHILKMPHSNHLMLFYVL